jgi:hypothetical protein
MNTKYLKGSGGGLIEALSKHLSRETEENLRNLWMAGVLAEIRTKYPLNKSLEYYR